MCSCVKRLEISTATQDGRGFKLQ